MKKAHRLLARVCAWSALASCASVHAAPDAKDPLEFFVMERFAHDDNLFRSPEWVSESAGRSADDYINRVSAGVAGYMDFSRQVVRADVRIDDVSYRNNDDLDYTGGKANLAWDWEIGARWSGWLSAQYERSQASWSNYQFFAKDLVDASLYDAEARYRLGTHWRLVGGASTTKTDHSARDRRVDNFDGDTARGAIEYAANGGSVLAVEYRNTQADLPVATNLSGISSSYQDSVPGVRWLFAYSEITSLFVRAGYLERTYDNPAAGDYSGEIWNALLRWEPRASFLLELKGWRSLRAYTDAESDYFVASGGSIGPTWSPTRKWRVSVELAAEGQDYIGVGKTSLLADHGRRDDVQWAEAAVEYTPVELLTIELLYRRTERDSNRDLRAYDSSFVSMQLRINL